MSEFEYELDENYGADTSVDDNLTPETVREPDTTDISTEDTDSTPETTEPEAPKKKEPKPNSISDLLNEDTDETSNDTTDAPEAEDTAENVVKKPESKGSKRIQQLANEKRIAEQRLQEMQARLEALENERLTNKEADDTDNVPNPENYQYGAFDPEYTRDLATYEARRTFAELQAQSAENERNRQHQLAMRQEQVIMQQKVEAFINKGNELYDDFHETVHSPDYPLEQASVMALTECDNAAEIAYRVAKNLDVAVRLSKMTPLQQQKAIFDLDREITQKKVTAKATRASAPPPKSMSSGGSPAMRPDTENFADFMKQWDNR